MAKILDHEYDGIQEYDNPIPTWLTALFVITTVFGIGYAFYFPALPGHTGISGWSSANQYEIQMDVEETRYAPLRAEAEKRALEALSSLTNDPATLSAGKEVFALRCAPCHGENAEGRVGPSLKDEEWLYGGDAKNVLDSIREGRPKGMPKWKNELGSEDIQNVTAYVLSLNEGAPEVEATPEPEASPTPSATTTPQTTSTPEATETPASSSEEVK